MVRESIGDSKYSYAALDVLNDWRDATQGGGDVSGIQGENGKSPEEKLTEIELAIKAIEAQDQSGLEGTGSPSATIQPMSSGLDPNQFPVRGSTGNGGMGHYHWTELTLIVAGHVCQSSGCEDDTDRITCRITVDPGAISSRLSWTCGYVPNSGNFDEKHFEMWAVNRGDIMGTDDSDDLFTSSGGTGKLPLYSKRALNGSVLTVAVALWVHVKPTNQYIHDGAKTADAKCNIEDNSCSYVF